MRTHEQERERQSDGVFIFERRAVAVARLWRSLPELRRIARVRASQRAWRSDMDWNRVEGNWKQVKGKVKEKWGKLTDDDLDIIDGRQDQLEGKIQEHYGYAKEQVHREVEEWFRQQRWH
jgi:uncharacterized protein YjbJ (UPF0337 family)